MLSPTHIRIVSAGHPPTRGTSPRYATTPEKTGSAGVTTDPCSTEWMPSAATSASQAAGSRHGTNASAAADGSAPDAPAVRFGVMLIAPVATLYAARRQGPSLVRHAAATSDPAVV